MKKDLLLVIAVAFVLSCVAFLLLVGGNGKWNAEGRTITVDDDGEAEFTSIQEAINASEDGDTIRVWDGEYYENIRVEKEIGLIGNGSLKSTINGSKAFEVLNISADHVVVSGFNFTSDSTYRSYGISIRGDNVRIEMNTFSGIARPIVFNGSRSINVSTNTMIGYVAQGIQLIDCMEGIISDNTIPGDHVLSDGIFIQNSTQITVENNSFHCGMIIAGIRIQNSRDSFILKNDIESEMGMMGILIEGSNNISVRGNLCDHTGRSIFYGYEFYNAGIFLYESTNCTFQMNELRGRGFGIEGSLDVMETNHFEDSNLVNGRPAYIRYNLREEKITGDYGQIILMNCSYIEITNQTMRNTSYGIVLIQCYYSNISESTFSESYTGIYLWFSMNCSISSNRFEDVDRCIFLSVCRNSIVRSNSCENGTYAIHIERARTISVVGNDCSGFAVGIDIENSDIIEMISNSCIGLRTHGIKSFESDQLRFLNNTCSGNDDSGIFLWDSHYSYFSGNICDQNGENGISLAAGSENSLIEWNSCNDNNESGLNPYGDNMTVLNNSCNHNRIGGITTAYAYPFNRFENNSCMYNGVGLIMKFASHDIIVRNNDFYDNFEGFRCVSMGRSDIDSNKFFNNTSFGMNFTGVNNCTISRNEIAGNYYGIWFERSSDNEIIYNNITSNEQQGLLFNKKSEKNFLRYNILSNNGRAITAIVGTSVDARFNYWGDDSGPYDKNRNPSGRGDNISGDVDFSPWLASDMTIVEVDDPDDSNLGRVLIGIVAFSMAGLIGTIYLREDLRYLLLVFLTAPLYTKLEKDDILDQPKRQEVFSYIVKKPGSNLTRLHRELPIGYGTLVHHLKVLEREKHIRSRKEMGRKLFFPTGTDWVTEKKNGMKEGSTSALEEGGTGNGDELNGGAGGRADSLENLSSVPVGLRIIEYLKESGPATQKEIGKVLGVGITTVSYNLRNFVDEGKVKKSEDKRGATYELMENS